MEPICRGRGRRARGRQHYFFGGYDGRRRADSRVEFGPRGKASTTTTSTTSWTRTSRTRRLVRVGIAEYYSTVQTRARKCGRRMSREDLLARVRNTMLIPLGPTHGGRPKIPGVQRGIQREIFFAESWALVHYLTLGNPARTPQLGRFMTLLHNGRPQEEAFREAFQTDYATLLGELVAYIRNRRFTYNRRKFSDLTFSTEAGAAPMSYESVLCRLGDLLVRARRLTDAERHYEAALASQPANADALAGLGTLRLRQEKLGEAASYLRRAAEAGSTDFRVSYEAGKLRWRELTDRTRSRSLNAEERALLDGARADFRRSIALNPRFPEARAALGRTYRFERRALVDEECRAEVARRQLPTGGRGRRPRGALHIKAIRRRRGASREPAPAASRLARRAGKPRSKTSGDQRPLQHGRSRRPSRS